MRDPAAVESYPTFESLFYAHHERITRLVARIIRDPGRAELAVEVFWKFWRSPNAHGSMAAGWLHHTAVRMSINELRRQVRATRKEAVARTVDEPPDPTHVMAAYQEQQQVRIVLAKIDAGRGIASSSQFRPGLRGAGCGARFEGRFSGHPAEPGPAGVPERVRKTFWRHTQ